MATATNPTAIEQGFFSAFEAEGYIQEDGSRDTTKLRESILAAVPKVLNKKERIDKALTRGSLLAQVFPKLAGPDEWADQPDPALAYEVHKKVDAFVWGQTAPKAGGPIQTMVGLAQGNGYVLCQTKITKDRVPAVYVTDDISCIQQDFTKPGTEALERKIDSETKNREMLVWRRPQDAQRIQREYDSTLKTQLGQGKDRLKLAADGAQAASVPETDEDE